MMVKCQAEFNSVFFRQSSNKNKDIVHAKNCERELQNNIAKVNN